MNINIISSHIYIYIYIIFIINIYIIFLLIYYLYIIYITLVGTESDENLFFPYKWMKIEINNETLSREDSNGRNQ